MKWFDNWFANKCKQAWESAQNEEKSESQMVGLARPRGRPRIGPGTAGSMDSTELQSQGTTFKMFQANGGTVIELRHYDDNKDRWDTSLHVIPSGEDMGKTLEHIITYEALKR